MKVIRAEKMGFCFGVKEAVNIVGKVVAENTGSRIYMLGMLVHNKKVVEELKGSGVKTIEEDEIESLSEGDVVIIRAHGITQDVLRKLESKRVKIYDSTCIFVTKIKKIMTAKVEQGFRPVIIGDKNHPEVKGIISYAENVDVAANYEELKSYIKDKNEKVCIMAQTTLNKNLYEEIKTKVKEEFPDSIVEDTICGATQERQKAVEKLAKTVDIVLVVGGAHSSNTKKLFNISKAINERTYFIESKDEINNEWFREGDTVGITAGTSTPESSINEVEEYIIKL